MWDDFIKMADRMILHNQCGDALQTLMSAPIDAQSLRDVYMLVIHGVDHDLEAPFQLTRHLILLDACGFQTLLSVRNPRKLTAISFMVTRDVLNWSKNLRLQLVLQQFPHAVHEQDDTGKNLVETILEVWCVLTSPVNLENQSVVGVAASEEDVRRLHHDDDDDDDAMNDASIPFGGIDDEMDGNDTHEHDNDIDANNDDEDENMNVEEEERRGLLSHDLQHALTQEAVALRDLSPNLAALWGRVKIVVDAHTRSAFPQENVIPVNQVLHLCMCQTCRIPPSLFHLAVLLSGNVGAQSVSARHGQSPLIALLMNPVYSDAPNNTHGGIGKDILASHVRILLHFFPTLARVPNGVDGRLPLLVALQNRHHWDVVQLVLDAFPAAVSTPLLDPVRRMYSFLLPLRVMQEEEDDDEVFSRHAAGNGEEVAANNEVTSNELTIAHAMIRAHPAVIGWHVVS